MFALPALKSLKAAYPAAEVTLLAADWQGPLLEGRGIVDRVIEVPPYHGVRGGVPDARATEAFFERMEAERFDLAVQMHGGGRNSNPLTRRLGARITLGHYTPDAEPLDISVPYVYLQPEVFRYLELVAAVGCAAVEVEPSLPVLERDLDLPAKVARALDDGRRLVLIGPGASDPRRRWPIECYAAIAETLSKQDAQIAVVGAEEDRDLGEALQARVPSALLLTGEISLSQFVGLASRAALLVANDSGPLNTARAVGTPSVGIYWIGNMINAGPLTRSRHRAIPSWQIACSQCGADMIYNQCDHAVSFVSGAAVDEVLYNALDLLGARPAWLPGGSEGATP